MYRIIDANINRLREALRVIEDVMRFSYNDEKAFCSLKAMRHALQTISEDMLPLLLAARESDADVGMPTQGESETTRSDAFSILRANFVRAEEASRALEETLKTVSTQKSETAKTIRYDLYTLEKETLTSMERAR